MGFFSNIVKSVGETFNDIGSGVENVLTSVERTVFGPDSDRGARIGEFLGSQLGQFGSLVGSEIGSDISQRISTPQRREITADDVAGVVTEADYVNMQNLRDQIDMAAQQPTVMPGQVFDTSEVITAGLPAILGGQIIKQAQKVPPFFTGAVVGGAMDIFEDFFGGDDNQTGYQSGMGMCMPAKSKAFGVSRDGCITITRKQQAKLKELVRMVGIEQASKTIGLPVQLTTQLLLKTFRSRRRGISGADLRTVKRVDRQMHSLACALGGISTTSRAVAARKSPPARKC
jgi:hypothetical protein